MERIIEPEILDHLDPTSAEARRSRFDLRVVNYVMGGDRWIVDEISKVQGLKRVVEVGAGDGHLIGKVASLFPELEVIGMDLIDRPAGLKPRVLWESGDILNKEFDFGTDTVVVANMFLHRFDGEQLEMIGRAFPSVGGWLSHEPYRSRGTLASASLLWPFMGRVTRHDMMVSIRAGFQVGEIQQDLASTMLWTERVALKGGLLSKAVRQ
jgi:hypothetical protein